VLLEYHKYIEVNGKAVPIINDHKAYIVALKILRNKDILEEVKADALLPLLFKGTVPDGYKTQAIIKYFELFADKKKNGQREATFDIIQDADYIYAGFMQVYGIDLDECEMKIEKFIALLKGLPSDTRLSEIIRIRTMEVPKATKYNAKQISDILRAKRDFALEGNEDNGMKSFGKFVKEWARHGR